MSDVQDPSDFPQQSEAPGLRLLDSALRCTICSELYDGPVTLKCGHCFCSLCIRQSLVEKQECPTCREDDVNEGHLRRNPVLEEAVTAWKQCRYIVRNLSNHSPSKMFLRSHILQTLNDNNREDTDLSRPPKKRKLHDESWSPNGTMCADLTSFEAFCKPDTSSPSSRSEFLRSHIALADHFIRCPVCDQRVRYEDINHHLDKSCREEPEIPPSSKSQWDNILGSKSKVKSPKKKGKERMSSEEMELLLPTKSYDTLKDKVVRELLREHGLPTTGDRKTMIARHQRWVIIFNANLDRTRGMRKSLTILRRELRDWETQQKNKTKHDVQDPIAYQIDQKSEFDTLVEAARPKKASSAIQTISRHGRTTSPDGSWSKTKSSPPVQDVIVVDSEEEN
ncbi:hypothetical protein J3R30DRAFT_3794053 [Lentinula aciculospora]|nr:hypothetical protein J3R30DRAFT_3794053 [Lentinula aciculospora]